MSSTDVRAIRVMVRIVKTLHHLKNAMVAESCNAVITIDFHFPFENGRNWSPPGPRKTDTPEDTDTKLGKVDNVIGEIHHANLVAIEPKVSARRVSEI